MKAGKVGAIEARETMQFADVRTETDRLLSVREVATLTGLAVGTVYRMISKKRVPVVRLSSRYVKIRLSHLLHWWDEMTEQQNLKREVDSN